MLQLRIALWRVQLSCLGQASRKFLPLFGRVLAERSTAETVTKRGIMLPEKPQGKVLQAKVVAVGSRSRGRGGVIQQLACKLQIKFFSHNMEAPK